jgi:hypothetical protein
MIFNFQFKISLIALYLKKYLFELGILGFESANWVSEVKKKASP